MFVFHVNQEQTPRSRKLNVLRFRFGRALDFSNKIHTTWHGFCLDIFLNRARTHFTTMLQPNAMLFRQCQDYHLLRTLLEVMDEVFIGTLNLSQSPQSRGSFMAI